MKFKNSKFNFYTSKLKKKIFISLLSFLLVIDYHNKKCEISNDDFSWKNKFITNKMSLVVPTIYRDFIKMNCNFIFYKSYIKGISNLIIIGDKKIGKLIMHKRSNFEIPLNFVNENTLIDIKKVKNLIKRRNEFAYFRSGWYIQQFLKMQYCRICQDKYYLIWDSDTIPIKDVRMFNSYGKPFFDIKTEYHEPYFITMKKIFPGLEKKWNYSFISEHMLIKTEIMKNLINRIEINNNLPGDTWYEKIINCIDIEYLDKSGFSEFETYGAFVNKYYNNTYDIRPWKSLREGSQYYNPNNLNDKDIQNISKNYDAISFEY